MYFAAGSSPIPRKAFAGVAGARIAAESPSRVVTAARRDVDSPVDRAETTTAARRDLWVELTRPVTEVVDFANVSICKRITTSYMNDRVRR